MVECLFNLFVTGKFLNKKTMKYLPLCPVYGIGAVLLIMIKPILNNNIILYFIAGVIVCSAVENLFNGFFKTAYKIKFWDYSDAKYNFNGNICLSFSVIWGLVSILFLSISDSIMIFLANFPNIITFFLLFCFVLDLVDTLYFFKSSEIKSIQFFCEGAKKE